MPQEFQLLIKPASSDCNQACRYCFYRRVGRMYPRANEHRMSGETLETMIRRYLGLRLRNSVFCWQGGEPTLMGLDFFQRAVHLMQTHGRGGQSVTNALQTNGLLIDEDWCRFLARYHFLVGLSLDGPAELHDAYRKAPGLPGEHADVLRALRLMQEHHVEFNVLAVVNDLTARHAKRIYTYFRELGLNFVQFIPCLEKGPDGRPAPFSVSAEAYGEFLCELFDLWLPEARSGVSERLFDALLCNEVTGNSGLCYLNHGCGNYFVVEHNGDIYPCDFYVEEEWRLGNITATSFEKLFERGRAREFRALRHRLPTACAECRWKGLCNGGCLKDRGRLGPHYDAPTFYCKAMQRIFAHAEAPIKALAAEVRARMAAENQPPQTQR